MKFLDPMPPEMRKDILQEIREHREVLRKMLNSSADQARRYLTITNAGAAVALMAYMGTSTSVRASPIAWWSLCFFVAGLIATGVLAALDYHMLGSTFDLWLRDSDEFIANKIELAELYGRLNIRSRKKPSWAVVAGYVAFGCFIVGGALSAGKFLASSIHPMQGPYTIQGSAPWCALDQESKILSCGYYSEHHCENPYTALTNPQICVPRMD